jgi:3-dehydroquinate dehydratase-1
MRLQSEKKITVKGKVIGGVDPLICLPLVAETKADLLDQATDLTALAPDLLEWRIDGYGMVADIGDSLQTLTELRAAIGEIPLIFTCRIDAEGGILKIDQQVRLELITEAVRTAAVDIIDVEMCNEQSFIDRVIEATQRDDAKLIFSYHNFDQTPDEGFIHAKLVEARDLGADIAKVAVMPNNYGDVLTLLSATLKARTEGLGIPIVTMAMGPGGAVTRLAGGLFGSDITFAIGKEASAPGQIPIGALRKAMDVLYAE